MVDRVRDQEPKVQIIAEAGVNHNGSVDRAHEMIRVAAACGADVVKFQAWSAELLTSRHADMAAYQITNTGQTASQLDLLKGLELPRRAYPDLIKTCEQCGVEFLCTPMDLPAIAFLSEIGVRNLKIGSGEVTNAPFLVEVGRTGIPSIFSTGMASVLEVKAGVGALAWGYTKREDSPSFEKCLQLFDQVRKTGELLELVTLLHCTTEYPTPFSDVNLRAMQSMQREFGLRVGYSDHTAGINVSIAAAALGACTIEKHFTLDRALPGPDHRASLEPQELKEMVLAIREVEQCLGQEVKGPAASERKNMPIARKSLIAARNISQGEKFTTDNLVIKRPGNGVSPWKYWEYLGHQAKKNYSADDLLLDQDGID